MLGPLALAILALHPALLPTQAGAPPQPPATAAQAPAEKPWPPAGVVRMNKSLTAPRLIKEFKPNYTPSAMRAGIAGTVWMELVVESDGTVGEVRVTKSLDKEHGLDEQAVRTVQQWEFTPGRKDGTALPVLVEVQMTFTLK